MITEKEAEKIQSLMQTQEALTVGYVLQAAIPAISFFTMRGAQGSTVLFAAVIKEIDDDDYTALTSPYKAGQWLADKLKEH